MISDDQDKDKADVSDVAPEPRDPFTVPRVVHRVLMQDYERVCAEYNTLRIQHEHMREELEWLEATARTRFLGAAVMGISTAATLALIGILVLWLSHRL